MLQLLHHLLDQEVAEGDAAQPLLAVRDGIEDRRVRPRRAAPGDVLARLVAGEQRLHRRGQALHQRDLDEDQRLARQRRVEEAEAAPVRGQAPPQVVPALDLVDRLVLDQLLQHRRRRLPVDAAQLQEAAVEPGAQQVLEVGVERLQHRLLAQPPQHLPARRHQRGGAAQRHVHAPQQLLARRLGRIGEAAGVLRRRLGEPRFGRGAQPRRVPARNCRRGSGTAPPAPPRPARASRRAARAQPPRPTPRRARRAAPRPSAWPARAAAAPSPRRPPPPSLRRAALAARASPPPPNPARSRIELQRRSTQDCAPPVPVAPASVFVAVASMSRTRVPVQTVHSGAYYAAPRPPPAGPCGRSAQPTPNRETGMDQAPDQTHHRRAPRPPRARPDARARRATCTQMLGDLGAEIIKIERPGAGDDTRGFAPPFWPNTKESAYFLGANRNKKSVALDIAKPEGQAICPPPAGGGRLRRAGGELQGRRAGQVRAGLGAAPGEIPEADLLLDHRLRPDRPLRAAPRLRRAGPGDGRHHVADRRVGRPAAEGGRADRRPLRRPLRLHRRPRGAEPPQRDRARASASTSACWTPTWRGSPTRA